MAYGAVSSSTYDLHFGHVLLPPEVLVVLGSEAGEAVVHVHHEVDKAVEPGVERAETTCNVTPPHLHTQARTHLLRHGGCADTGIVVKLETLVIVMYMFGNTA